MTEELTQGTEDQANELTFTPEQQAFIDKRIGQARVKAREIAEAKLKTETEAAKTAAQRQELEQSEEWKKLAQHHETRVSELEPLTAEVERYRAFAGELLKTRIKDLGDVAKKAIAGLPGELDDLAKLAWLEANISLFKTEDDQKKGSVGTPRTREKKAPSAKPKRPEGYRKSRI